MFSHDLESGRGGAWRSLVVVIALGASWLTGCASPRSYVALPEPSSNIAWSAERPWRLGNGTKGAVVSYAEGKLSIELVPSIRNPDPRDFGGTLELDFGDVASASLELNLARAAVTGVVGSAEVEVTVPSGTPAVLIRCVRAVPQVEFRHDRGEIEPVPLPAAGAGESVLLGPDARFEADVRRGGCEIVVWLGMQAPRGEWSDPGYLRAQHIKWWNAFWGTTRVDLPEPELMAFYERSKYLFASGWWGDVPSLDPAWQVAGWVAAQTTSEEAAADDEWLERVRSGEPIADEDRAAVLSAVHRRLAREVDGVIEWFPDVPESWSDVSFEGLRLPSGDWVSGVRTAGETQSVTVYAAHDGELRLRRPFEDRMTFWNTVVTHRDDRVVVVEVEANQRVTCGSVLSLSELGEGLTFGAVSVERDR